MLKQCITCKVKKKSTEFSKNRRQKDGIDFYCKVCKKLRITNFVTVLPEDRMFKIKSNMFIACLKQLPLRKSPQVVFFVAEPFPQGRHVELRVMFTSPNTLAEKDLCEIMAMFPKDFYALSVTYGNRGHGKPAKPVWHALAPSDSVVTLEP